MSQSSTLRDAQKHPQRDPYKRSMMACNRCRKRKTKCLGGRPCPMCELGSHDCVYEEAQRKVLVPQSYLRGLEARVRTHQNQRPAPSTDAGTSPASSYDAESEDIDDSWMEGMENLVVSSSGQSRFQGPSSATTFGLRFRDILPMSENYDLAAQMDIPYVNEAAWPRRQSVSVFPQLPPYDFAKRLYAAQHIYIGTIFSFLQPQDFEERLKWVYSQVPDFSVREACLSYCQILLIFAYGQMYSVNQWAGNDGPPGFTYFMQALQLLPDIHEEGSILFVEVLSLVGYYMQNLNRRDAAFLYIGLALRMAISLGLHQEVSDSSMDASALEHRRRVWWSVYSMDRILCVKSGNPITIADEDIGVSLPSPIPGLEPQSSPATTLSHYTRLSKILGKIMVDIYRKTHSKTGSNLIASVQTIMSDLTTWLRELPAHLRLDFTQLDNNISRESVSIFLHYYQCINMTARPLLFHVVQRRLEDLIRGQAKPDWREGLSPTTVAVIESCITAARASTTITTAAAKQNLIATYGFMDGEHAFSAALILVMVNVALPYNSRDSLAMESALGVLRGIAERGNTHIRARHSLLMDLRSVIGRLPSNHPASSSSLPPPAHSSLPIPAQDAQPSPSTGTPPRSLEPTTDFNDMSFDLNMGTTEDVNLWEEVSGNIGIGMDFDWIEAALRSEGVGAGMGEEAGGGY